MSVFSAGLFIAPNKIDLIHDARLFLKFFENPIIIGLMVFTWVFFTLFAVWARRKDKEDHSKVYILCEHTHTAKSSETTSFCIAFCFWLQIHSVFVCVCEYMDLTVNGECSLILLGFFIRQQINFVPVHCKTEHTEVHIF